MSRYIFLVFLVFISFLFSCSKKVNLSNFKKKKFEIQNIDFQYLNSRARVRFENDQRSLSLNANIRIKKDSIIWVSLSPVLGIEIARGLITSDSVVLLNRMDQEYEVYDYAGLSSKFNFSIDYQLIQSMLLGNMPMDLNLKDNAKKKDDLLMIEQLVGGYLIENYISPKTMKLRRVFIEEVPTRNTLNFEYDNFHLVEKSVFPYSSDILLSYNSQDKKSFTKINIDHNRVNLKEVSMSFPFSIPDKYIRR